MSEPAQIIPALFMLLLSDPTGAQPQPPVTPCATPDLEGSWSAYLFYASATTTAVDYLHCDLTIKNKTVQPGTLCIDSFNQQTTVLGGEITVDASCKVQGHVQTDRGGASITPAQMTLGKDLILGVVENDSSTRALIQVIKKP